MRRICKSGTDNVLYFFPADDPCPTFTNYHIWGRDATGGPFLYIDSVTSKTATTYTHVNANPAGIPKKWTYYITYTDPCQPPGTGNYSTDSIDVDELPPDSTFIDSASIDIATNQVVIGWKGNRSADFFRYLVYRIGTPNVEISPPVLRDTFLTDNGGGNPQAGSITYDLTASDSCGTTQVFGFNPHTTMFLRLNGPVDTCRNNLPITWSPYVGWKGIRSYYIIVKEDLGPYQIIDSVDPGTTNYDFPIILGRTYSIFIRAYSADGNASAASNSIQVSTRFRVNPASTYLASVSAVDPDGYQLEITYITSASEEYGGIRPLRSDVNQFPVYTPFGLLPVTSTQTRTTQTINDRSLIYLYRGIGNTLCHDPSDTSNQSPNIVLNASGNGINNSLVWNFYFGWDNGVEKYRIYRGTNGPASSNISYTYLDEVLGSDTVYTDSNPLLDVGNRGTCYYVEAVQNNNSIHGIKAVSKSFSSCVLGSLTVFIPNAFCPDGVNRVFKPEGSFIDYMHSELDIYDRWGSLVTHLSEISTGWDGKTAHGVICPQGVYFYRLKILSTNGTQQIKTGTVTLIN